MKVMALDGCLHAGRVEYVLHGDPAIKRVFKTDMSHNLGGSCLISLAKYTIDLLKPLWEKGSLSRKSAIIFGQRTIPEPSTPHIGREVALVARTAAFVYI